MSANAAIHLMWRGVALSDHACCGLSNLKQRCNYKLQGLSLTTEHACGRPPRMSNGELCSPLLCALFEHSYAPSIAVACC